MIRPERAVPDTGKPFFRVHRGEVAEIEVAIYQAGGGVVLLRWVMAGRGGRPGRCLHPSNHQAGAGRSGDP
jgi:hypothetical protein